MAGLIKRLIDNFNAKQKKQNCNEVAKCWTPDKQYELYCVRVCALAQICHKKQKYLTAEDILKRVVDDNVLMVSIGCNWYMDIETGKKYEFGGFFGEELENPNNEYYITAAEPLYYACYETIKDKNLQPNDKLSDSELRQIYNEHQNILQNRR